MGMTRAMEKLYLTGAQRRMLFGNLQYNAFSRFLEEIPDRNKVVYDLTRGRRGADVLVVGLTGDIGAGKSTVAASFRE